MATEFIERRLSLLQIGLRLAHLLIEFGRGNLGQ